jgi:hypothetical protein
MKRAALSLGALGLVIPAFASAQDASRLTNGDRIRVTASAHDLRKYVGEFRSLQGDTIILDSLSVPLASVARLEVSAGRKSQWASGMIAGLLVGAGVGALAGAIVPCAEVFTDAGWDEARCVGLGAAAGGGLGLLVGAVAGGLSSTDRWEEVPLNQLRMRVITHRGGLGLGVSLDF